MNTNVTDYVSATASSNNDSENVITPAQFYTLCVILASTSCALSLLASIAIVISSYRRMAGSIYQRLIFMISFWDAIASFMNLIHWYLMPRNTREYGLYLASGNTVTCAIAGYWFYLGPILVSFYSFYLSFYFYCKIKYNILDSAIKKKYIIPAHIIAFSISFGVVTLGLFYNGYNPRPYWNLCINGECVIGVDDLTGDVDCSSRGMALAVELIFTTTVMILAIMSVTATYGLYSIVRYNLQKNTKYQFRDDYQKQASTSTAASSSPSAIAEQGQQQSNNNSFNDSSGHIVLNSDDDNIVNDTNAVGNIVEDKTTRDSTTKASSSDDAVDSNIGHKNDNTNDNDDYGPCDSATDPIPSPTTMAATPDPTDTTSKRNSMLDSSWHSIAESSTRTIMNRRLSNDSSRRINHRIEKHRTRLIEVRNQGITFVIVYLNSFLWLFIKFVFDKIQQETKITMGVLILSMMCYVFFPIQGLLNFIVYTTPRYKEFRKKYPTGSRMKALYLSLTLEPASDCMKYFQDNTSHFSSSFYMMKNNSGRNLFRRSRHSSSNHNSTSSDMFPANFHPNDDDGNNDNDNDNNNNNNKEVLPVVHPDSNNRNESSENVNHQNIIGQ